MCGLVAVIRRNGQVDPRLLAHMRDALRHRGPDAADQWIEGGVGLAHRRLSIIDVSDASAQPMHSEDGRLVLVFNGEIYNYIELREELRVAGRRFRTSGDTEVLLQALDHWGEAALPRLNGMFAFALWDRRERRLLVARDRFGEKPLFLARPRDGGLTLASEMKALLHDPNLDGATDLETQAAYVNGSYYEEGANTFFANIKRAPAAHAIVFDEQGREIRRWRYWTPDYERVDEGIGEGEAIERFHDLLTRSVRMRLRSDVRVGSSLSGGLDSSVVVGMLAQERTAGASAFDQDTYSARFPDDPTMDEGEFIDAVVDHTGVRSHSVSPTPAGLMAESRRLHWHQEEPVLSASIYLQFCVARLAQENGSIVQLDGQGADELLGGYQFYYRSHQLDLVDKGEWAQLEHSTRAFNERMAQSAAGFQNSARRFNAATAFSLDEIEAMRGQNAPPGIYNGGSWTEGLPTPGPGKRVRRIMAEAMQYNCLPQLLRYADRNAMAFSREGRLPYLDHDLVDFTISLPDRLLFSEGWQKYILRKAGERYIPPKVCWRADKVGYAAPLDLWMRGALKDWCYERAFEGPVVDVPGYDTASLQTFWEQHQAGANNSWALWRWISLNEWLSLGQDGSWAGEPGAPAPLRVTTVVEPPAEAPAPASVEPALMAFVPDMTPTPSRLSLLSRLSRRLFGDRASTGVDQHLHSAEDQ
jgi:asparagine synthase (glutamine-hydrolysing)